MALACLGSHLLVLLGTNCPKPRTHAGLAVAGWGSQLPACQLFAAASSHQPCILHTSCASCPRSPALWFLTLASEGGHCQRCRPTKLLCLLHHQCQQTVKQGSPALQNTPIALKKALSNSMQSIAVASTHALAQSVDGAPRASSQSPPG
jgi:hypothetical protein